MISPVRLHIEAIKISLAGRMAYRGDFFISTIIMLLFEFVTPLVTLLIYNTGASFPGWSLYEVLLIQGVFLLSKGIAFPFFFGMVWNVLARVRDGTFDLLLIRPRSILHLTVAIGFDSEDLGKFVGGIILFTISILNLPIPGIFEWLQFLILFIVSLVILFSCSLFLSGIVFKWVGCSRVYEIFDSITSFSLYPRSIFSKSLQMVITVIIPIALIAFFPASVLLGKPSEGILAALVSSIVFLITGMAFWHWMLGKYTSAGG